jgi:hypothetical protein
MFHLTGGSFDYTAMALPTPGGPALTLYANVLPSHTPKPTVANLHLLVPLLTMTVFNETGTLENEQRF